DDVMTTGATVEECARVLKRAGAASVGVLTLARALRVGAKAPRACGEAWQPGRVVLIERLAHPRSPNSESCQKWLKCNFTRQCYAPIARAPACCWSAKASLTPRSISSRNPGDAMR